MKEEKKSPRNLTWNAKNVRGFGMNFAYFATARGSPLLSTSQWWEVIEDPLLHVHSSRILILTPLPCDPGERGSSRTACWPHFLVTFCDNVRRTAAYKRPLPPHRFQPLTNPLLKSSFKKNRKGFPKVFILAQRTPIEGHERERERERERATRRAVDETASRFRESSYHRWPDLEGSRRRGSWTLR
jgi:hypothetical protein